MNQDVRRRIFRYGGKFSCCYCWRLIYLVCLSIFPRLEITKVVRVGQWGRLHKNESSKVSRRVLRGETQLMIDLRASVVVSHKTTRGAEKEIRQTRARCYLTPRPVINFNSFDSILFTSQLLDWKFVVRPNWKESQKSFGLTSSSPTRGTWGVWICTMIEC